MKNLGGTPSVNYMEPAVYIRSIVPVCSAPPAKRSPDWGLERLFSGAEKKLDISAASSDLDKLQLYAAEEFLSPCACIFLARSNRRRPGTGRKPKSGMNRTRTVKAVIEDAKLFLGKSPEDTELNASVQPHEDSQGISSHTEEVVGNTARKRRRGRASRITESEQDAADSDEHSDSVTTGGRRKRRQTVAPSSQTPRYNLRRYKTSSTTVAEAQTSSDLIKTGETQAEVASTVETPPNPTLSPGVDDENGKYSHLVQVTSVKQVESLQDRAVKLKLTTDIVDDNAEAPKSDQNLELSEEVNATQECGDDDDNGSPILEDDEEEDDDFEHPGEVSIGKKLWNFFTS